MSQQTDREIVQYMLDNKHATHVNLKWGAGYRNVVIFQGKKYQYKAVGGVNKILIKSIFPLYIKMSSNVKITKKTDDEKNTAAKKYKSYIKLIKNN